MRSSERGKLVVSKHGQSSTGCLAVGHGWSVELLRGHWSAAPEGSVCDEETGCVRGGVCARRELRTKAWRHLEWSSNEELLEWAGETPQLHAEGKLFVTEMKIRDEEAVEEEHACSDGEPDDAASDPESVLQEAAVEPPLPPPPTPPFFSGASRGS